MQTHRYNGFWLVHKALRAAVYATAIQLQQTDFEHEEEVHSCFQQVNEVLHLFSSHSAVEDRFILPLIQSHHPVLYGDLISEHDHDDFLVEEIRMATENFFRVPVMERMEIATQLHYSFYAFAAFNLTHMNKEELLLNKILWQHYSDEEIISLNRHISLQTGEAARLKLAAWLHKGCGRREWAGWQSTPQSQDEAV